MDAIDFESKGFFIDNVHLPLPTNYSLNLTFANSYKSSESSIMVNGPLLRDSIFISAPNTPV